MSDSTINTVLGAIDTALGVIKSIADTPGINLIPYVSTVSGAIGAIQAAEELGKDIMPYVTALQETFTGQKIPTLEDLQACDAKIAELDASIDSPPPDQPDAGEPA